MKASVSNIGISFNVEDVSGQKRFSASNFNKNSTVSDMVEGLTRKMGLPTTDASGNKVAYRAFSKGDSRHLNDTDLVGDTLKPGDDVVLQPNINAGAFA